MSHNGPSFVVALIALLLGTLPLRSIGKPTLDEAMTNMGPMAYRGAAMADFNQVNGGYVYAQRYTDAMAGVAGAYPKDLEAQTFYALASINSDPADDVALSNPKKAVAILYPIFRKHPDHPGIAHYISHACDNPEMAQQGLEAARR